MHTFYRSCVGWPDRTLPLLFDIIDNAQDITRATFKRHVDLDELKDMEDRLGYERHPAKGLIMANDWHVSYHKAIVNKEVFYFFRHSAIEYVWREE